MARAAWAAGATRFGAQPLFLKPSAARVFLPWISKEYPALAGAYQEHFATNSFLRGAWVERMRETVRELKAKYGFPSGGEAGHGGSAQMGLFQIQTRE